MKTKVKGFVTPLLVVVGSVIIAVITGLIVSTVDSTGWESLGALIIVFMFAGLVLLALAVIGLIKYIMDKSDYWLGVLLGIGSLVGLYILLSIFIILYNYIA